MALTGRYFKIEDGSASGSAVARSAIRHPTVSISANTSDAELAALGYLPEDRTGYEPFDGSTQKRTGPVYDYSDPSKVVAAYTVTDKTAQELDDEKAAQASAQAGQALARIDKLTLTAVFHLFNMVRANHGQQAVDVDGFFTIIDGLPTISDDEFVARIKAVLD